jgi:hypothetical protein
MKDKKAVAKGFVTAFVEEDKISARNKILLNKLENLLIEKPNNRILSTALSKKNYFRNDIISPRV